MYEAGYLIFDLSGEVTWQEWRRRGIGGSDAAAAVGRSPYKSNLELFEEKTGLRQPVDISGKECVCYGRRAEAPLRELFALDYPQYRVEHHDWRILQNIRYPFQQASLDGELTDETGRKGILEIKTANLQRPAQREEWEGRIPDHYYIQVLHYFLVSGYAFAVVCARLLLRWGGEVRAQTVHHVIERSEVQEDLDFLLAEEIKFWEYVETGKYPPRRLPEI